MDELVRIEEKIFAYVINTISFLKTLKKRGLSNDQTEKLAEMVAILNNFYGKSAEINIPYQRVELWKPALQVFEAIHGLLMNMHYQDYDLVNEKADLQIETSILRDKLSSFIQQFEKQIKN